MKRKIFYIGYSIVQFIASIYCLIFAKSIAESAFKQLEAISKFFPKDLAKSMMESQSVESLMSSVRVGSVICIIVGLVILIMALKDKIASHKAVGIVLMIIAILAAEINIIPLVSIIGIIVIATDKSVASEKKEEKAKKEFSKLRPLKVTAKDLLLAGVLVVAYSSQFLLAEIFKGGVSLFVQLAYYVSMYALSLFVFSKRLKRDFGAFKENFPAYFGFAIKMLLVTYGCSILVNIVKIVLGGNLVSGNQEGLNSEPILFVAPLAILWAPMVEESVFRGVVRRFIKHDVLFIIVSAVLFGLIHTIGSETDILNLVLQSLPYACIGGVLAYEYTKTNNICVNMLGHALYNTLVVVLMFVTSL